MLKTIWKRPGPGAPGARGMVAAALAVSYPLCAHAAIMLGSPGLTLASVVVLAAAVLFRPLAEGRRWAWVAAPPAALGIAALWRLDAAALVLYLPPILLNVFLAWLFGHTLRPGSTPLIERLVVLLQPPGQPAEAAVLRYVRRLTWAWTLLFTTLAIMNLALAACVSPGGLLEAAGQRSPWPIRREAWSLFANVLNYAIVIAFFVLEFSFRMRRFPDRPYRSLPDFLRRVARLGPALAKTFAAPVAEAGWQRSDRLETTLEIPADHAAFPGHFPGRPVLPGVVLLELVIEAAAPMLQPTEQVAGLPWVKFLAPLLPGDRVLIRLRRDGERLHFEVLRSDTRVAHGVCSIGAGQPAP